MADDRVIAEIRTYEEFTAALRAWVRELGVSYETVGEIAGLQDGYLAKMISRTPVRSFSRMSLGSTLAALCLKLQVVVDTEKLVAMRSRYMVRKKQGGHADEGMPRKESHYLRGNSGDMSMLRHRGLLVISPRRRRQIARIAARERWANRGERIAVQRDGGG
jgi:hypothetical protein